MWHEGFLTKDRTHTLYSESVNHWTVKEVPIYITVKFQNSGDKETILQMSGGGSRSIFTKTHRKIMNFLKWTSGSQKILPSSATDPLFAFCREWADNHPDLGRAVIRMFRVRQGVRDQSSCFHFYLLKYLLPPIQKLLRVLQYTFSLLLAKTFSFSSLSN